MSLNKQLLRRGWPVAALLLLAGLIILIDHFARLPETLSQHETLVYGQNRFVPGVASALRVVVRDSRDGEPLPGAGLRIALRPGAGGDTVTLYSGQSGPDGTTDVTFTVPEDIAGQATLIVETSSRLGSDRLEQPVTVARDYRILLATDKPIYQPGQLIHMRALALAAFDQQPAAGQPLEIVVADAKGNKVFRRQLTTSDFGVAAVDFQLASEVNTGAYKLTATLGNTTSEKTVTVEHYVLPKFRAVLTTERPYYLPGERVRGTVRAEYFYGKAVAGGTVKLEGYTFDVARQTAVTLEGTTGPDGVYAFEFDLPAYIAGTELEGGRGRFYLEASATDLAAHTETANLSLPVSASRIVIEAMPEGGQFRPGVENILYVLTSYPDGTPAESTLRVSTPDAGAAWQATAGPYGLAEVRLTPQNSQLSLQITATDRTGAGAQREFHFEGQWSEETVLLRPARAVAYVGETLTMTVLTSAAQGTVYLDLVRAGQTMSTRAVPVSAGRAEVAVDLTPDLAGTLELHAYKILRSGSVARATRLVVVDTAAGLSVSVTPGRDTYRPGDTAGLDVHVAGADGTGVQAALGLAVVDEAVFALADQDPGFARLYFMLEQEILQPRVDLHGLSVPQMLTAPAGTEPVLRAAQQGAAQAALAAALVPDAGPGVSANSHAQAVQRAQQQRTAFFRGLQDLLRFAVLLLPLAIAVLALAVARAGGQAWAWLLSLTGAYLVALVLFSLAAANAGGGRAQDFQRLFLTFLLLPAAYGFVALASLRGPRRAYAAVSVIIAGLLCCGPVLLVSASFLPSGARSPLAGPMAAGARGGDLLVLENAAVPESAPVPQAPATTGAPAAPAAPRLRQYFPETMLWLPEAITGADGTLRLDVPVADSITTWRITALASTRDGRLGSTTAGLRVFQDFFVDLDLPVALTVGDEIAVPVGVFNYLPGGQQVRLDLEPAAWFEALDATSREIDIAGNDIGVVYFRVRALDFGTHAFKVTAYGSQMSDAIQREVRVYPNGKELRFSYADRLAAGTPVTQSVHIPDTAIPGTQALSVKIYPGILSQVVEGLDSLLRMPYGCFEQTSSTTYPNVLVLDYLRATNQASPEAQFKAEEYINLGYQRLTTFEVEGTGGFSLFGNVPADRMLTAYGLQEFSDMSRVYDVDPALVQRAAAWLLAQQDNDGSWANDKGLVHESSWQNLENDRVPVTAYVAWSLIDAGFASDARTQKGIAYVREHLSEASDAYVLALAANALVADDLSHGTMVTPATKAVLDRLAALAVRAGNDTVWQSGVATFMGAEGQTGSIETTALAALAFQRARVHPDLANAALASLVRQKDSFGTWHTTQATVLALKALIQSVRGGEPVDATVTIRLNDGETRTVRLTPADFDVVQVVSFADARVGAENVLTLSASGTGNLMYQVSGGYYVPWSDVPVAGPEDEGVAIAVTYDRTQLAVDDTVTVSVTVRLNKPGTAQSALIDLGLPPGFAVQAEDLAALVARYTDLPKDYAGASIERYELTGRQILVYASNLKGDEPLAFSYRLKAKFPLSAQTPASSAYDYYNPAVAGELAPQTLVVTP